MKSTQAVVRQRVEEVLQMRLAGAEFLDIRQYASQNGWGVSDRQLWRYIAEGDDLLAEMLETDRAKLFNRAIAERRHLLARCIAVNDFSNARALMKDLGELLDLYPAKKTELTGKDGGPLTAAVATVEL